MKKVSYRKWMLNSWALNWRTFFVLGFNAPFFLFLDRAYYISVNYNLILVFAISLLTATIGEFLLDTGVWFVRKGDVAHLLP